MLSPTPRMSPSIPFTATASLSSSSDMPRTGRRSCRWPCMILPTASCSAAMRRWPRRGADAGAAQGLDDRQAVDPGQQAVHDHHVGASAAGLCKAVGAGRRTVHQVAAVPEVAGDLLSRFIVVLDQQQACHGSPAIMRLCCCRQASIPTPPVQGQASH